MQGFFSAKGLAREGGLTFLRLLVGLFLVYHGWELFDAAKIKEYAAWDLFHHFTWAPLLVRSGKGAELAGGLLLAAGLFTRAACLLIVVTMLFITFVIGTGKIWYEDQYPFLFAVLAMVYFFNGPGRYSLDHHLFEKVQ